MTEEDTFLKLKRIDFLELCEIINHLPRELIDELADNSNQKEEFLNAHGWKSIEFDKTVRQKYPS